MKNLQQIRQDVMAQAEVFNAAIKRKDWAMAKAVYEDTRCISIFIDMSGDDIETLFGSGMKPGLFKEEDVQKAYYEVAVKNLSYDQVANLMAYKLQRCRLRFE